MSEPSSQERFYLEQLLATLKADQEKAFSAPSGSESASSICSRRMLIVGLEWLLGKENP